ncbi:MAG TPA: 16S rRNA (guanine(527)-N(7))-methyltransferase RsmG [Pyrinomonadaceae bacterium]|jgi:16S rRNA (guanine527-N7)-methyltransferase
MNTKSATKQFREALESEATNYGVALPGPAVERLSQYYELLNTWNSAIHLVAPCSPPEFATRHVLESLLLLKYLPTNASIAEVGAGAGLPILPCLILRPDIRAVLIEASQKKAVFLREALSRTATSNQARVIAERFENVPAPQVDFVTCRALERFEEMVSHLLAWAPPKVTLLLFGGMRLERKIESLGYASAAELMPKSKARFLLLINKP